MKKMKVVHFTSVHPPFDIRIFHRECKALVRAGHSVLEIAPSEENAVVDGIQVLAIRKPESRVVRFVKGPWQAYSVVAKQRADVYHFHDPELLPVGLALQLRGRKVIYDSHEDLPRDIMHKDWIPQGMRRVVSVLVEGIERFVVRQLSGVIAADEHMAQRFRAVNRRTVAIRNYPLAEEFGDLDHKSVARYGSATFANFGGISRERCIEECIRALEIVDPRSPVRMTLAGSVWSGELRAGVEAMPGWGRVSFRGFVSRPEMVGILGSVCAAIILFSDIPNHQDVRSNRLFEAMAAGLPVISSNFPRWREIVEENGCGICVDPRSPEQIAAAMERFAESPALAREMGQRGRELFERKFNWSVEEAKLAAFYQEVGQ